MKTGEVVWRPPSDARGSTRMGQFCGWLERERGLVLDDYDALWRWSIADIPGFWSAIWDHFDVIGHDPAKVVLKGDRMPDVRWFPGATLNYAENALRWQGKRTAVIARSQTRDRLDMTWDELHDQVARARIGLMRLGVRRGDRVAAYLPNIPETLVAYLATASLGAIWSSCAPEFGVRSVIDRFGQIAPKVLLTIDGYRYGDKRIERHSEVAEIRTALSDLVASVVVPYLGDGSSIPGAVRWADLVAEPGPLAFEPVPFDHPLVIVYSSGTTGMPKAILHGHGGLVLEHLKALGLHQGLGCEDRCFRFTTTGWIMWNILASSLLLGSTALLFDGSLAWPDLMALWRLAEEEKITHFGAGAGFLLACRGAGLSPGKDLDLSRVRLIGSTGSPLPTEGYEWIYTKVTDHAALVSGSGGTDIASGFVGGAPLVPIYAGEMSCRSLGCDVVALDPDGTPVIDQDGELVVRSPMPSMPVGFWGDDDGSRLRAAYFEHYPGLWRHGDWLTITPRGSCVIGGRSDATLNRGGVRLGTAEFYSAVEEVPEVNDSLVVHLEGGTTGQGHLLLFVALAPARTLDDRLKRRICTRLKEQLSPRHVPDEILAVREIPRTLTGKKLEIPVKRILLGDDPERVISFGALASTSALEDLVAIAQERLAVGAPSPSDD